MWPCVLYLNLYPVKCILLYFSSQMLLLSHFYVVIFFCVCFVLCSCHLQWFYQLLNLLGITPSCFGVFLIANPAVLWLGLKHFFTSLEVSVEYQCCLPAFCKAFHRAAGCFLKSGCLLLSFFWPVTVQGASKNKSCDHWGCDSAEWDKTRRALCSLSGCTSEGWSRREIVFTLNW